MEVKIYYVLNTILYEYTAGSGREKGLEYNFIQIYRYEIVYCPGTDKRRIFNFLARILKTGNWLGPLLVAAASEGVKKLLLFGYHGKLIKLSGGIFHTHHHLADGRLEILTSLAVREGISLDVIKLISKSTSVENALLDLELNNQDDVNLIWARMAKEIEIKSLSYVNRYLSSSMEIGSVLFDRKRQIRWAGFNGLKQINSLGLILKS